MTFTLEHITPEDEATLLETMQLIVDMGNEMGDGWYVDKSTVNQKSATLTIRWDAKADPMKLRKLPGIFQQAPAIVSALVNKLADYPLNDQAEATQ